MEENEGPALEKSEQDNMTILFQQKLYADRIMQEYVLKLLTERGLDPTIWGISGDCKKFEKIKK